VTEIEGWAREYAGAVHGQIEVPRLVRGGRGEGRAVNCPDTGGNRKT
jgi:hypothetical protein